MPAPRKYDEETRARAVRMYTERIRDLGESKLTARRQVGSVLDIIDRAWATPSRPDQWWVADFTYVWTLAGFVYVSFVTDWGHLPLAGDYSRRILGWRVSTAKTTPLVASALEQALFTRRRGNAAFTATGLIHHSDAGSQGGFNWSSQHPDEQGCDDGANGSMGVDEDRPPADALAGAAAAAA